MKHYLQVTDDDYTKAVQNPVQFEAKGVQNPVQQPAAGGRKDSQAKDVSPCYCESLRNDAKSYDSNDLDSSGEDRIRTCGPALYRTTV